MGPYKNIEIRINGTWIKIGSITKLKIRTHGGYVHSNSGIPGYGEIIRTCKNTGSGWNAEVLYPCRFDYK